MKESETLVAFHVSFHVSFHPNTKMIPTVVSTLRLLEEAIETPKTFSATSLSYLPSAVYHVSFKSTCLARCANQVRSKSVQVNSSQFKSIQTTTLHIARCMRQASVFVYYLYHRRVYCIVTIAGPHNHSLVPHFL